MPSKQHLHTIKRAAHKKRKDLFMCLDPDCSWRQNRMYLEHKRFQCPKCGKPYIITRELLRLRLPHCYDCTTFKKKEREVKKEIISDILKDILDKAS